MDKDQIDAARRGDRQAIGELLRALQDPWFRLCLSLLGDPEKARDAVQETALRFLRQIAAFRGDSSITTWSMGIAINVVRETRRKKLLTLAQNDDEDADTSDRLASPAPAPADVAASHEQRDAIRALLHELPQRQREAVVLRFFEELSVEETAAAMDCAPGTVKATIHQALRSLKRRLEQMRQTT